ncbi:MAG: hypothetical protein CMJ83_12535 [Planctomycetes bacterium]|nr:hypothetical protein [Planctomycetota bacterium]
MGTVDPDRILSQMEQLPPLPEAVARFIDGDPSTTERDVARSLMAALSPEGPDTLGHGPWWGHALATAMGARRIAEETGRTEPREAFVAGLLHDVGHLVLVTLVPAAFRDVLGSQGHDVRFLALERQQCGLDHVRAGIQLIRRWQLPDPIAAAVAQHHVASFENEIPPVTTAAIVVADTWAQVLGCGYDFPIWRLSGRTEEAASSLNLLWGDQLRLLESLDREIVDLALEFGVPVSRPSIEAPGLGERAALWVSLHGSEPTPLGTLLLRHRGFRVIHIASTDSIQPREAELVLIDSPWAEPEEVVDLVDEIVPGRRASVALLSDPRPDQCMRRRDTESGICGIPRLFTAFDLRWVESCPVNS